MVVTSTPSAWTASRVHDFTDSPSRWTVQDPHEEVSQPTLVPGEAEPLAQEVDEELALLHVRLVADAVDRDRDALHVVPPFHGRPHGRTTV